MFQQLVTIVPWNFVAAICNLLIQMWLIKKFLFKPVQKVLAQRQQLADAQIADAEAARADAEAMRADYEQRLAAAKEEAAALVQSATRTAQLRSEEILRQAQADAVEIKNKADADIAQQQGRDRRHRHGHRVQGGGAGDRPQGPSGPDRRVYPECG